jgi:hypothetical protein
MSAGGTQRRLATILAADVVGYSRLMGQDEAGTLAALKALRTELLEVVSDLLFYWPFLSPRGNLRGRIREIMRQSLGLAGHPEGCPQLFLQCDVHPS